MAVLAGRVAVVTGASVGIGAGMAAMLAWPPTASASTPWWP
jgi:NAD(P)-dependent dehydrogenase (short-subunit alcohol dehydrogenase family)